MTEILRYRCVIVLGLGLLAGCSPAEEPPMPSSSLPTATSPPPAVPSRVEMAARRVLRPWFERFTVADGLTGGLVDAILQDRRGFLWVGSWHGLHRYNGASFTSFRHDPSDRGSIASTWVWDLYEDRNGYLWIGTEAGLSRFDPATETFTNFRHAPGDLTSLSVGAGRSIVEDTDGVLWVGTVGGGLSRFNPETETFTSFYFEPDVETGKAVYALAADPEGGLWVGANRGLYRFDSEAETFTAVRQEGGDSEQVVPPDVFALQLSRSGALWVGSRQDGLYRRDTATGTFTHYPANPSDRGALGHRWVLSLLEDAKGTLWVGTDGGGLHRYNPSTDDFDRYVYDPDDAQSIGENRVLSLFEDRSGVLWIGTYSGLDRRYPLSQMLDHHQHRPGDPTSPGPHRIMAFLEDRAGALWVGTDGGGASRRDPRTERFKHYLVDSGAPDRNVVAALAEDSSGAVWAGTYGGISRWDTQTDRFSLLQPVGNNDPAWTSDVTIKLTLEGGYLWAATFDGLLRIEPQTQRYVVYLPDSTDSAGTDYDVLLAALPDTTGLVWIGGFDGSLGRFDTQTGAFVHRYDRPDPGAERWGQTVSIHRDRNGTVWVATGEAGLIRLEGARLLEAERLETGEGLTVTQYGLAEGLPGQSVNSLLTDAADDLWLTTPRGLSRLDVEDERFYNFGPDDGLLSVEVIYRSPHSGRVYMSAPQGYYVFDPADIAEDPPPTPLVLTGLRLLNEEARVGAEGSPLDQPLWMTDVLRLDYDDRVVTFEFAALDFRAPTTHRYAVRLDGFDEEWREVGEQREATFTNLSPGSYTLQVRVAGRDGVWGEETTLAMTVAPPWWATWWAYLGYALAALGLLTVAYRARRRRHEFRHRMEMEHLEAENLRELDQARSHFFANVSHEFRTPLTLTLGPLDDLQAGLHGPLPAPMAAQVDLARRNAGRVLDLINQILDVARLEAGRTPLRAHPLDLGAFVAGIAQPFQDQADRKALTFEVDAPPVEVWADPAQLEKAVANLLSNAVKFTPPAGTVRVTVRAEDGAARVAVRDSGPGIPAADLPHVFDRFYQVSKGAQAKLGTGIGLALAKEVVDLHGGQLTVESEEGFGSTFTVTFPLGRAHLTDDQVEGTTVPWSPSEALPSLPAGPGGDGRAGETPPVEEPLEEPEDDVTTVLVVEDHAEVRAYVRRHLEPGYRVLEASDGEAGLALAKERLPDLVVSDVMMPKLDGLGLCRALKADAETDFIPVILLTAKAAPEDKLEGLGEHCDDYLTKPFDPAELRARIDNLIAGRTRLRERFRQEGIGLVLGEHAVADLFRSGANGSVAPVAVPSAEEAFLAQVREAVEASMADDTYSSERLAEDVGLSRSQLNRRLKPLLGQSSSVVIRTMRLDRAARLLAAQAGTVSEVAYAVGFKSVAHFSNAFLDQYGCRPSAYEGEA